MSLNRETATKLLPNYKSKLLVIPIEVNYVQLRRDLQSSEISVPIRVTSGNRGGIRQL